MFNADFKLENGEMLITLEGCLDATSSRDFDIMIEDEISAKSNEIKKVTIDAEKLDYISSAGLRSFLQIETYLEDNLDDHITVINAIEVVKEIFEVTGFSEVLNVE